MNDPFINPIMIDIQNKNFNKINKVITDLCRNINFNDVNNEIHCICLRILLLGITSINAFKYTISSNAKSDSETTSLFRNAYMNTERSISELLLRKLDPNEFSKLASSINPVVINVNGKPMIIKDNMKNIQAYFIIVFIKVFCNLMNAKIIDGITIKYESTKNRIKNIDFVDYYNALISTFGNSETLIKINENNLKSYMTGIKYETYMKKYA
jgi:hypothetical protein